jgi:hypothetical protein
VAEYDIQNEEWDYLYDKRITENDEGNSHFGFKKHQT